MPWVRPIPELRAEIARRPALSDLRKSLLPWVGWRSTGGILIDLATKNTTQIVFAGN
jgi:hypothetical protein